MSISVYRLYLGSAWAHSSAGPALLRALDFVPSFFYRLDKISEVDIAATGADSAGLRNLTRIAMTQSHVVLIDADRGNLLNDHTPVEISLAHSAFRTSIPVLAITRFPDHPLDALVIEHADRVVSFDVGDIVCAVQELAEEAAAARRRENDRLLSSIEHVARDIEAIRWPKRSHGSDATRQRVLPAQEIAQAYATLVAQRSHGKIN